jgi:nucleoside-diphosphate-sugar epimerase
MKTVAISGASGFVGTHLQAELVQRGLQPVPIPRSALYAPAELRTFFMHHRPDYVIHAAAAGNMYGKVFNNEIVRANTLPLFHILEFARQFRFKGIINISSSSVLLPHQTIYSATKRGGEALCQAYAQEYNLPIVTARPYSLYGPGEAAFRFIPTVFRSCLTDEPMTVAPDAVHDWLHVRSFAQGITGLLSARFLAQKRGQACNFGLGVGHTNAQIVRLIQGITGKKGQITPSASQRSYDSSEWVMPLDAQAYIWHDEYVPDVLIGLLDTYPYYRDYYEQKN